MPYVELSNFDYVGSVVPKNLRSKWNLLKCPDRYGIRLLNKMNLKFDLIHYDSDKTYFGRYNAYSKLYKMLKKGGIFISYNIISVGICTKDHESIIKVYRIDLILDGNINRNNYSSNLAYQIM